MPFPISALIQQFLEQAESGDMLSLLSMLEKIAGENVPVHLRAGMAAEVKRLLAEAVEREAARTRLLGQLSDAEVSVVLLIAAGKSYRAAAGLLGVTERTIRAHVESSVRKLGITPEPGDKRTDSRLLIARIFLPDLIRHIG
ncbi:helix-turn-helix transcriptional regulator [Chromobacterium sp. CV08]|uniref:helix-turn-helix transcriptional regulator n=1 Tax=Chromobacterium sp. CV08 TaxID=3133274 RepID=UPI003DAA1915